MNIKEIQEQIDEMDYWDSQVLGFNSSYFGDEIEILIESTNTQYYKLIFNKCYEVFYRTDAKTRWKDSAVRNMRRQQLGYYAQGIIVSEKDNEFVKVDLDFSCLTAEIVCKDIKIQLLQIN